MSPRGRRQPDLPGMERKDLEYPEVEEAAVAYTELCEEVLEERRRLSKKLRQGKQTFLAAMHARKLRRYSWRDQNGETVSMELEELEEKVVIKRTGEATVEIGEGVETGDGDEESPTSGLIAQALKAQADAGVAESDDGEVVPRDDPPAKKKRGGRKGKAK